MKAAFALLVGSALATTTSAAPPAAAAAGCMAGRWAAAADPAPVRDEPVRPVRLQTTHFAFRWAGDVVSNAEAESAGTYLEYVWSQFIGRLGFPEPDCAATAKLKVNIVIDPSFGLTGGVDDDRHIGMWIGPGGLRDRFSLAHELTHALQGATGSFRDTPYAGWLWESHANWMTTQLPEFRDNTHCSVLSVDNPHLYFGSTRVRYCNWQFLEYLKDRYGYPVVNDLWRRAPARGSPAAATADPMAVLMANRGWSIEQLNDAFGEWALHNAGWDYTNPEGSDQGAIYRRSYGEYVPGAVAQPLRVTVLDPIDRERRRYAVPAAWAPQRWGYNLVKLTPDPGARAVTVTFRGIVQSAPSTMRLPGMADEPATVPPPASGWRWGLVAVGADGRSRYSGLRRGAQGHETLAIRPDDRGLFLAVVATPTRFQSIRWDQPYYSLYRYPWMAQFDGALPAGPGALGDGHRHLNGGGWIGQTAKVAATAYVGPCARVLGGVVGDHARIEGHALVIDGQVLGRARVEGLSVIQADTTVKDDARVATTFQPIGAFEHGIVLSGSAQLVGDVEERGVSARAGVYYGLVDSQAVGDAAHGATLTAPVPELTAAPSYRWRR
ncbi:hypothetical protein SAMN05192583_3314 [Sphingomonas gellani]|uniref:Avirulence protein n=1 Tax=Sphingomonas gellani TaxID=1166340 RepID=A0A1H8IJC7_9SPHN|nr:Svx/AvrXca family virulence/avirulence protein [Sphingomonas gellani]SEN68793.1 hypothetical protein SAMN05192583_3314 [Sphingomonas gellani]